jgi:hypothetical protein
MGLGSEDALQGLEKWLWDLRCASELDEVALESEDVL